MSKLTLSSLLGELGFSYHIENIPFGIIAFNKDQEITFWSERATQIFEWKELEALNQSISSLHLIYSEDLPLVTAVLQEITSGNKNSNQFTNRNNTKSGAVIYCEWYNSALKDASGNIVNLVCFVHDVTEQMETVQKVAQSQQQLSLIYNGAIDPMWLIYVEGKDRFRFENINHSFTKVTGLRPEQVIGHMVEEVLPQSSHQLVKDKYNEAVSTGKVIDYTEIAVHPAGERVGEIRVIPIKNDEGIVTRLLGIANDITEERALQRKLDKERELFSQRITAAAIKGQEQERNMISRELHDNVNQILTTVKLYTDLCAKGRNDSDDLLPKCSLLLTEAINEIRDISKRLGAPSLNNFGLEPALNDLITSVQQTQMLDIHLDVEPFAGLMEDEDLQLAIYRITQEQLTNILKHAKAQSVFIRLECTNTSLTLTITDNGVGFDTSQKRDGIGMTNMASRTRLFNGTIKIESAPGKGCTLRAYFPVDCVDEVFRSKKLV